MFAKQIEPIFKLENFPGEEGCLVVKNGRSVKKDTLNRCAFLQTLKHPSITWTSNPLQHMTLLSQRPQCEDTFHVVDLTSLFESFQLWKHALPNVLPHYSVKTNPDPMIVSTMFHLGANFDCASQAEIKQVLSLGVDPSKIIFANPRKSPLDILYAKEHGVCIFTLDSLDELEKMMRLYPEAQLLLRIKTDDSHSSCHLSSKFGTSLENSYPLIDAMFLKKANLIGIAFHVGSNCSYLTSYRKALFHAAKLFHYTLTRWNKKLCVLDIGGGWPGTDEASFIKITSLVKQMLHDHFDPNISIIAEPGRFFAAKTTTLAMRVLGKEISHHQEIKKISYYMSNGVYGFFQTSLYFQYDLTQILREGWHFYPLLSPSSAQDTYPSLLWGATCDSGDKIIDQLLLPELTTGDFLLVDNIGAYGSCVQTSFNGMPFSQPYYIAKVTDTELADLQQSSSKADI